METFNSFGFVNFWGVTPSINILDNVQCGNEEINILISNSNDIRHILKTMSKNCENGFLNKINFYFFETYKENLARAILFIYIIHDSELSVRDRVEILMEIYGNTLLSSRTSEYLNSIYKNLINFVTNDNKYKGILDKIIDLSLLSFKEKDDLLDIFSSYNNQIKFDIEKYRDDRLRYLYKERYDVRENLIDWDYQMNMRNYAPVVMNRHYVDFRQSGIPFQMRINKYIVPNRTLSSYIPGRDKKNKDSCNVRGFWGDIVNSPFIGFGAEIDDQNEFYEFYKHNDVHFKYHAQNITEFNLMKYLVRLEKNEHFDFLLPEKEKQNAKEKETKELKMISPLIDNIT